MDYKKKYEDALERARQVHTTNVDENKKSTEYIFPELKDNEDEKIRKEILQSIKDNIIVIHKDKCIAWLEKQDEQNSTWSEEDESLLQEITNDIKIAYERAHIEQLKDIYSKQINWLKSIKERMKGE